MTTMCEECDKAPATHLCKVAGCGDERIAVCCECKYKGERYGERCTPEDDCWTVDEAREYQKKKNRSPYADFDPANPDVCDSCKRPGLWCNCP